MLYAFTQAAMKILSFGYNYIFKNLTNGKFKW